MLSIIYVERPHVISAALYTHSFNGRKNIH